MSYLHDWKIHHLTAVCSSPETKTGFSGNEACILTKGIKKHPPSYQCLSSGWQTEKENRKSKNTSCTWLDIVITSKTIHVATPTKEFSVGWGKVSAKPILNPLHPDISMYILNTVHYTNPEVLTGRIWSRIKSFFIVGDHLTYSPLKIKCCWKQSKTNASQKERWLMLSIRYCKSLSSR